MPRPLTHWFVRSRELLASRHFIWIVIAVAVLLGLPTLDAGLHGDDLQQQEFLRRYHAGEVTTPWWDMFTLVDGSRTRTIGLRTSGRYPWWVDPELHIAFFRPVAVLTHHLDHWLWPRTLWLMHLHSVLWHALACALAWLVARRLTKDPATASIAALVFAMSLTHTTPVGWLAHRNGLVSTAFALAALLAHDHWRRDERRLGAIVAPVLVLAALLSAEAGVVAVGFLAAYAVFLDRGGSWWRRLLSLTPCLAITAAWLIAYSSAGFGAVASGAYINPLGDPRGFLLAFPGRYLWLIASSLSAPLMPTISPALWVSSVLLVGVIAILYLVRDASEVARFGALAVILGCVPLVASHPGPRLLVMTSFGSALVFAELIDRWLLDQTATTHLRQTAGVVVALIHVLVPPVAGLGKTMLLDELNPSGKAVVYGEPLPNEGLNRKGLVIVHAPNYVNAEYLPIVRTLRGLEAPNFTWLLHAGPEPPEITRVDTTTLELHDPRGWPGEGFSEYWRSATHDPFQVGDRVRTIDYEAEIIEVDDRGKALRVQFHFRTALEHSSFVWAIWNGRDFAPVDPGTLTN